MHENKADNISAICLFSKLLYCYAFTVSSATSTPTVMTHAPKKIPACIYITPFLIVFRVIICISHCFKPSLSPNHAASFSHFYLSYSFRQLALRFLNLLWQSSHNSCIFISYSHLSPIFYIVGKIPAYLDITPI